MVVKYLPRTFSDADDFEAQDHMLLASTYAGIGFGNAGPCAAEYLKVRFLFERAQTSC